MKVENNLSAGRFVELLDGDPVGPESLDDGPGELLNGTRHRGQALRLDVEDVARRLFGDHEAVAVATRHDVHERERVVILVELVRGNLAAQDLGEDVGRIVGVGHGIPRNNANWYAVMAPGLAAPRARSMNYIYLMIAIGFEVVATTALKQTDGFTRLVPSIVTIVGYGLAFYFLSLPLRALPVGVVYALWSGIGIVLITAIGWLWFRQALDGPAILGMGLIVAGVLVINLFSRTLAH